MLIELNSSVIPTKSSQSTSVLIETATDLQTSKTTCLGVRSKFSTCHFIVRIFYDQSKYGLT